MKVAIDIGGTKTLLAAMREDGQISTPIKFPTDRTYNVFIENLADHAAEILALGAVDAVAAAVPGRVDRQNGIGISFGNLPWEDVPIQADINKIFNCPVLIENDANLAGLSEAHLLKGQYEKVLYITISTGIGTGIITNGAIDPAFADSEGGQMPLEHDGKLVSWESFASGSAIVAKYGKRAADIHDEATWREIVPLFARGILDLLATVQPQAVVIGGGVGSHFDQFGELLQEELNRFATDLVPIPPILPAQHAEQAVVYGCFDLLNAAYGTSA